jgi:hypothetical protein
MVGTTRGTLVPASKWLLATMFAWVALQPMAAFADDGMVDVRNLPRLEGAVEDTTRTRPSKIMYSVPSALPETTEAIKKLLAANGWVLYTRPAEEAGSSLSFKKGAQGLYVSFTQRLRAPNQSSVYYDAERINANLPVPDGATDVVFDENRPYLNCTTPQPVDATLDFFRRELSASGWSALSASDAAGHWPNANLDDKLANGVRAYYNRGSDDRQPPVMLSLQRRADGKTTGVDIRIAPFALPQNLALGSETAGLPEPNHIKTFGSTGNADSNQRKLEGAVIADIPAVLAFYRHELATRNWKEEATGAVITVDAVALNFSTAEETAVLKLGRIYDLTSVSFVTQIKPAALAARAKAKKEADDKFFSDAQATAQAMIAADEVRRAGQAKGLSDAPVQASADAAMPVPLPDGAESVEFDGAEGKLEFDSTSSVAALATFYRGSLKAAGWKEEPSVINKSNMVVMEFAKAGKKLSFTVMQMGPKANVSADGSGLVMANATTAAKDSSPAASAAQEAAQNLEADPDSALPVPKQHSMSSIAASKIPGTETPFRRELTASIPADLTSVLGFYRRELGKLGWKEAADGAAIKPDQAQLLFSSPDGPATLKLGRDNGETSVDLAQKMPAAAAKADIAPKPGQARLLLGNIGNSEAALTINRQTIKIAAGAGGPRSKGPTLDLPPGKYQYSVKVAGGPSHSDEIEVAADDAWGLMIAPTGEVLPLHVY